MRFFSALARPGPPYGSRPGLLIVACLMTRGLAGIDGEDGTESAPAVVTAIAMPLTFSIANGMGIGFITYAAVKVMSGKGGECPPAVYAIALLFVLKFSLL